CSSIFLSTRRRHTRSIRDWSSDVCSSDLTYPKINENDPMPYSTESTLKVREFRGESGSPTLWTTTAAMEAWNLTRRRYGKGIYEIGRASCRDRVQNSSVDFVVRSKCVA